MAENRFSKDPIFPHQNFIDSKQRLGYVISDVIAEFCDHHGLRADQIQVVVTAAGSYVKITF